MYNYVKTILEDRVVLMGKATAYNASIPYGQLIHVLAAPLPMLLFNNGMGESSG